MVDLEDSTILCWRTDDNSRYRISAVPPVRYLQPSRSGIEIDQGAASAPAAAAFVDDGWVSRPVVHPGHPCARTDIGPQDRLDLIYLWVNGSDRIWQEQYDLTRELEFPERSSLKRKDDLDPPVRHYRSQGTLRYALRSGVEAFRRDESSWIRKMHVLTADMPIATDEEEDPMMADYRLGQIPDWLDKERVFQVTVDSNFDASLSRHVPSAKGAATARDIASLEDPPLQWHFHSEIFRDPIVPSCDASAGSCAALRVGKRLGECGDADVQFVRD
ncbi:hypothetical protein QFC20_001481 [Naganishia adeliensis]|uniref:Uncharacterized protein n=1 Tax=Naganishia adeliensis TaxID=92952 RepID=A0ACC2WRD3_9TREE|nr:hypothetical protein QFC20_001481 [Naganishia adeliensis]